MTEPSRERIAAALALAEAVDERFRRTGADVNQEWALHLQAYRATAPKLRTRAEVDAERLRNFETGPTS